MKITKKRIEISIETHEKQRLHVVAGQAGVCQRCGAELPYAHPDVRGNGGMGAPALDSTLLVRAEETDTKESLEEKGK